MDITDVYCGPVGGDADGMPAMDNLGYDIFCLPNSTFKMSIQ